MGRSTSSPILLWIGTLLSGTTSGVLITASPLYLNFLGFPLLEIGLISSLNYIIFGLLRYLFGRRGDRGGRDVLLRLSPILLGIISALTPFQISFIGFASLNLLYGVSNSLQESALSAKIIEVGHANQHGTNLGRQVASNALGFGLGIVVTGFAIDAFGYTMTFFLGAVSAILAFIAFTYAPPSTNTITTSEKEKFPKQIQPVSRTIKIMILGMFLVGFGIGFGEVCIMKL